MTIERLDHIALTVKSVEATCAFYERVLGLRVDTFGGGRKALVFGPNKINLHEHGREFEPRAHFPTPGSGDVCFITRDAIPDVIRHLKACGVEAVEGPVPKTGAKGPMVSVYFRDPDLNLVEVATYGE